MEHSELLPEALPLLIDWYRRERKPLPWRVNADPYRVWISEIMLQQTRIEAVIPYYHRFLQALPDVRALAQVPEDELLKLWEGLGYYSRARNLKKAAQAVMEKHGGRLPATVAELKALPGIGDYTAGAIASIACGQPEPAVDGNVLRVLSRLTESPNDVMSLKTRKDTADLLRSLYPTGEEAGLLTEGLMELGETLCIPNGKPACHACPWQSRCLCRAHESWDAYPVRSPKKERRVEDHTILILQKGPAFALTRRPDSGLLAGLWEFPNLSGKLTEEEARSAVADLGLSPESCRPLPKSKHVFSHVEWHMTGYWLNCRDSEASGTPALQWFTADQILEEIALPTAFRHWRSLLAAKQN